MATIGDSRVRQLFTLCLFALAIGETAAAQKPRPAIPPSVSISDDLARPTNLEAHVCGSTVELRWRDNSRAEEGFVILRRPAAAPPGSFQSIGLAAPNAIAYEDVPPAGQFVYRVAALGAYGYSQRSNAAGASTPSSPPVISTDLLEDQRFNRTGQLTFTVTVTDPEGDPVSLRLLNPPPGLVFNPLVDAPSPASVVVRWRRAENGNKDQELNPRLVFETDCGVRLIRNMRLADDVDSNTAVLVGDVTGDGIQDAVVSSERVGEADTGAIFVFAGAFAPQGSPSVTLTVEGDSLRSLENQSRHLVHLVDVTGDGELDVVSGSASRNVYVWAGGVDLSGDPAPTAVLVPSSLPDVYTRDLGRQFLDVNGDGVLDIITMDRPRVGFAEGRVYLWLGGPGLNGVTAPTRSLVGFGESWAWEAGVGYATEDEGVLLADVTSDGVLDFLIAAPTAHTGGQGGGEIFLWSGADVLAGVETPTAVLSGGASVIYRGGMSQIILGDLTGDGVVDILGGNPYASPPGSIGGLYCFFEGGALSGLETPDCFFHLGFQARYYDLGSELACLADVTGDGILDFVALSPKAVINGLDRAGAIYVWAGGALTGQPPPTATLIVDDPAFDDRLGSSAMYPRIAFLDLSGDGTLDLVTGSWRSDPAGVTDAGAIYVWNGGPLADTVTPSATLTAGTSTHMARYVASIEDLDGDGALDILASSPEATMGTSAQAGVVCAWSGASGFAGDMAPTLEIQGSAQAELLGLWVRFADLDGDGHDDLLLGRRIPRFDVWRGGPSFFGASEPAATLIGAGPTGIVPVQISDWDLDGFLDVMLAFPRTGLPGVLPPAGIAAVWSGGPTMSGEPEPSFTLSVHLPWPADSLASRGLRLGDLDGDGRPDLLAITPLADASSLLTDTGAVYLWSPRLLGPGNNVPLASFRDPTPDSGDMLGQP